jgi:hypothetical protein
MKECPKCQKLHDKPGAHCSRSCANKRPQTAETRRKQSEWAKANLRGCATWGKIRDKRLCVRCGAHFEVQPHSTKKFCSHYCSQKGKNKENTGGYRPGSGRAKPGYYKGIYCGSTWELAWVIYQLDHNISFKRFEGALEYDGIKYVPDFLQNGKIIEIKGYESPQSVDRKNKVALMHGYEVIVKRRDDLREEFRWMKEHYLSENWHTLYDDYKPLYTFICNHCGTEFDSERKRDKTKPIYCSRICAGKGNRS